METKQENQFQHNQLIEAIRKKQLAIAKVHSEMCRNQTVGSFENLNSKESLNGMETAFANRLAELDGLMLQLDDLNVLMKEFKGIATFDKDKHATESVFDNASETHSIVSTEKSQAFK